MATGELHKHCAVRGCSSPRRRRCPKQALSYMEEKFKQPFRHTMRLCDDHHLMASAYTDEKKSVSGVTYVQISKNHRKSQTGLQSPAIFEALLKYLCSYEENVCLVYAHSENQHWSKFSREDQLLITLTKLRTGQSDTEIAVQFNCSRFTVGRIWITWLEILHSKLKPIFEKVPELPSIQSSMPACFALFPNCRLIIDATEVPMQKPRGVKEQAEFYSYYKSCHTIKFLVAVLPNGTICLVSNAYPGSTSDKELFLASTVLDILKPGDMILADKGFLIADCLPDGITVGVPSGLWGNRQQFTAVEARFSRDLASARVHVERMIGYMKRFKIFGKKIGLSEIQHMSKIAQVIGFLVNFQKEKL